MAYSYFETDREVESWHMPILEEAFAEASRALAKTCGTGAAFEEKLAVLIYSEGQKRLRLGLALRNRWDADAVATIAICYFSRTAGWRRPPAALLLAQAAGA